MTVRLQRLRAEIVSDLRAFESRADELAALPPLDRTPATLAQAAVALHHAYGAIESALVRLRKVLEGDEPLGADWHQTLLSDMGLDVEGVRPALLSPRRSRTCAAC